MVETQVTVKHQTGLHARPAAMFVQAAKGFASRVVVKFDGREADAKSIMGLMALGIKGESGITISADGPDAEQATDRLRALIESNFAEE